MTRKHVKIWAITIVATILLVFSYAFIFLDVSDFSVFMGGVTLPAFLFALLDNIVCMGMIFIIIKVFYAKFNKQGPILRKLSSSAYHMYLLHPPVLVGISLGFVAIALLPILKFAIVFPLGVVVCYLLSHYVFQKIPLKRKKKVI